jgi:hypothetical protein
MPSRLPKEEYNAYMREYMRKYSMKRRDKVIKLLGGQCTKCGSTEDLQVHHVDPSTKEFTLASRWHRKWVEIEAELPKCILLCENCHRDIHRSKYPHGTPQKYWAGCHCKPCTAANTKHSREYKAKRRGRVTEWPKGPDS